MDKSPPNDKEAEEAVLGALLIDPVMIEEVANVLSPGDFYHPKYALIYEAMIDLYQSKEPIDFLTVCDKLESKKAQVKPEVVNALINAVPTSIHLEHYAAIVVRLANKRRLLDAAGKIAMFAYDEGIDDAEAYIKAIHMVDSVEPTGKPVKAVGGNRMDVDMLDALARAQRERKAREEDYEVAWPWPSMRAYIRKWRIGQPAIVIAEGGAGKTAFCMEVAGFNAQNGGNIFYVHTEDEAQTLLMRRLSSISGVPFIQIEEATYDKSLKLANTSVGGIHVTVPLKIMESVVSTRTWRGKLWLLDAGGKTISEIVYDLQRAERDLGRPDAVIFDWFGDHKIEKKAENLTVALMMGLKELKEYAADRRTRLLVAMQTGKLGSKQGRLTAYDAYWSSAPAHYGKVVMGLKREREMVNGEAVGPFKPELEVFISKANLDITGSFKLTMKGETFQVFEPETTTLGSAW